MRKNHPKKCSCHSQFWHQHARGGGKGNEENKLLVSSFQNLKKFQIEVISLQTNQNRWKQKKNRKDEHNAQQQKKNSHSLKKNILKNHVMNEKRKCNDNSHIGIYRKGLVKTNAFSHNM